MNDFSPSSLGGNHHRSLRVVSPVSDLHGPECIAPGWKQGGMPVEDAFRSEGLIVPLRGVHRHFDKAVDIVVGAGESAPLYTEPACHGVPDDLKVKPLAFDRTGLDEFFGESFDVMLTRAFETDCFEDAKQSPTPRIGLFKTWEEGGRIVRVVGPAGKFMNVFWQGVRRLWHVFASSSVANSPCYRLAEDSARL